MNVYLVGGAVRGRMLGLPVKERDWVVVGSTPDEMLELGYRQVGRDFPVFLHPETSEEYALARTERKTGPGHTGFVCHAGPEVTLEDDLLRRDLTINAMAQDADGELVDPFGGRADLEARLLRHVSAAFVEDPLRVFRVARFAAQLPGFQVAPETRALMQEMVRNDELSELAAERVWQEMHKALGCRAPVRFFDVLAETGALVPWFAELEGVAVSFPAALDTAETRFGALAWQLHGAAVTALCERLKAPKRFQRLAGQVAAHGRLLARWAEVPAAEVLDVLHAAGALRDQRDHQPLLDTVAVCAGVDLSALADLIEALAAVDSQPFREQGLAGKAIGDAIHAARLDLVVAHQRGG